jgi:hypothetical protein
MVDPAERDQVVPEAGPEVELRQFDIVAEDMVDLADMTAVGTHDFHMLGDVFGAIHFTSPGVKTAGGRR